MQEVERNYRFMIEAESTSSQKHSHGFLILCNLQIHIRVVEAERWVGAIIARNATRWMMGLFNLASFEHDEFSSTLRVFSLFTFNLS